MMSKCLSFYWQAPSTTNIVDQESLAAAEDTSEDNKKDEQENITLKTDSSSSSNSSSLLKEAKGKENESEKRSIPIFVMCTMMQQPLLVAGSSSSENGEEKFSAATLADVLVELPASLPFQEVVSYVLNQLHLMKEDTFCSKGTLLGYLQCSSEFIGFIFQLRSSFLIGNPWTLRPFVKRIVPSLWKTSWCRFHLFQRSSLPWGSKMSFVSSFRHAWLNLILRPRQKSPPPSLSQLDTRERVMSILFEQYYRDLKLKAVVEVSNPS